MALAQEKTYTIEDILALPENMRAELIDGQIYYQAAPSRIHQKLVSEFTQILGYHIKTQGGSCEVYPAPFAVNLTANDKTYVEPDISVICDPDKLTDRGCSGAPDLIIEVVSPSTRSMDYLKKLFKYRTAGVREYWIVDHEKNMILVYNFEKDLYDSYTFSDTVKVGIFEDLDINFSELNI